ncbi:hypothetical protein [Gluconacetobacter tumulisoli]|uniref:Uncharacterized protein n=1 Tax=Gluconacetobacter tumulisoli TaxID=1286189 RepID=A0A7W4K6K4_9PROT|nr:hypothetical protein [Gluconacetobacter tumulisoli]MBB2201335.1 hypothetical protein [Gluconacetobacter tumulisoli]
MASIDWRPISETSGFAEAGGMARSSGRRLRQRVAHVVATCAMGAWVLLAVVPVVVVIMAIG